MVRPASHSETAERTRHDFQSLQIMFKLLDAAILNAPYCDNFTYSTPNLPPTKHVAIVIFSSWALQVHAEYWRP